MALVHGYVVGELIRSRAVGPDPDRIPDVIPATDVTLIFTPTARQFVSPGRRLVVSDPIPAGVMADGQVTGDVNATTSSRGTITSVTVKDDAVPGLWLVVGKYTVSARGHYKDFTITVTEDHTQEAPLRLGESIGYTPPGITLQSIPVPTGAVDGQVLGWSDGLQWVDQTGGGGVGVDSVNGQTGAVVLDASDVGALPDTTPIPATPGDIGAQPAGDYATTTALTEGLSGKADAAHTHTPASIGAQPAATGTPDGTKFLRDDNTWAAVPSGGDPALLDQQIYSQFASLPGRAITANASDVPIGANIAIGSIFRLSAPAKVNMVTCSVKVAATAGTTGRVAIYSWEWDGTCTLVQDQGTVAIDTAVQQVNSNFTGSLLPAGEYVAVFIPEAAVTMRMLSIYDALLGFQGGQEFNAGAARAYAYPQATLGSYPGSAPAVLTMGPSTGNGGLASTSRSWCTVRTVLA